MKKNYLFIGAAAIMMAGCASDDLVGDENISSGETPIAFSMNTPNATRGEGSTTTTPTNAAYASKLGNMFIVWGEKNETNGYKADEEDLVFQNYKVSYNSSSINTTTSNTNGWEYVGVTPISTNLTPATPSKQTIKYWDDNANSYTFTAVSALESDIATNNKVVITKTVGETKPTSTGSGSTVPTVNTKGYTITIKDGAAAGNIYVADRVNIAKGSAYAHTPVTLTFRNFQSKIRFGIYETVPGYKVVITGLKYTTKAAEGETAATEEEHKSSETEKSFGITGNFVVAGDKTTYTVSYEDGTASSSNTNITTNKAKVTVGDNSSTQTYLNTTGTNWLSTSWTNTTTNTCIGTAANAPTWDKGTDANSSWTAILPNTSNDTNLKLTIKYDLYSEDTGEKISVDYKTVEVPKQYCQWKPNYAYTYLFKISDKTADLYPITFDACVVTEETGNQETITEVSEPSITTFGVKSNEIVTNENEYAAGDDIYATVLDGSSIATLTTSGTDKCINLYTVTTTDADKYPISEASVANAIKNSTAASGPIKYETVTIKTSGDDSPILTTTVPTEDGKTITLANSGNALKWTAETGKTYAIEYIKDANTKYYKIVKIQ